MTDSPEPSPQAPSAAQLEAAERAFERGDFVRLASLLRALSTKPGPDPSERPGTSPRAGAGQQPGLDRTGELERAVEVDPVHVAVLVLCLLGLIAVTLGYL